MIEQTTLTFTLSMKFSKLISLRHSVQIMNYLNYTKHNCNT